MPVGSGPFGVAVNTPAAEVYVANWDSNDVSIIDSDTNTVIATIPVGKEPKGVAVSPDGTKAYVTNTNSSTVSVINTVTKSVVANVSVGSYPLGVAVSPDGKKAYVTNYGGNTVSVIDTVNNTVKKNVSVGTIPAGVIVNSAGTKAYVANHGTNTVSVINTITDNVIATVPVGRGPFGVTANLAGSKVYVTNTVSNTVSMINTATNSVIANISVGNIPTGITIYSNKNKVYVANHGSNTVSVINTKTNSVTSTIPVGSGPTAFGQFIASPLVPTGANLSIYKQANISAVPGTLMTYTLYYFNFGNKEAQNVIIEDTLPGEVEFVSASDGGIYNSTTGTVTWNIGTVFAESNGYKTLTVRIPENSVIGTEIINNVCISTSDPETKYDDNEAQAKTKIINYVPPRHDPAGYIYDVDTWGYIPNASVWLQISDGIGGWENVPTGESVPIAQPDVNPLITDQDGKYQWDVFNGSYRVHVEAPEYESVDSIIVSVPPPVTDLDVGLVHIPVFPTADFSSNVTSGNVPLNVQFTDTSTNTTQWNWDFGDGNNSTEQNPLHTYSQVGNYTVNLTVSNEYSSRYGIDSKLSTITILEPMPILPPVADFSTNVTRGNAPLNVQFTDHSSNATEWEWDFDDGTNSVEQNPVHTYLSAGNYVVNLTVSNGNGDTDSKLSTITVLEPVPPDENVSSNTANVSAPVNIQIGNLSQNANEINWNIGSKLLGGNISGGNGLNVSSPINILIGNLLQNANEINWNIGSQLFGINSSINSSSINSGTNVSAPINVQIDNASQNATTINWNIQHGY